MTETSAAQTKKSNMNTVKVKSNMPMKTKWEKIFGSSCKYKTENVKISTQDEDGKSWDKDKMVLKRDRDCLIWFGTNSSLSDTFCVHQWHTLPPSPNSLKNSCWRYPCPCRGLYQGRHSQSDWRIQWLVGDPGVWAQGGHCWQPWDFSGWKVQREWHPKSWRELCWAER